jgi:hypothetical protein
MGCQEIIETGRFPRIVPIRPPLLDFSDGETAWNPGQEVVNRHRFISR